jgi:hypothetical protein
MSIQPESIQLTARFLSLRGWPRQAKRLVSVLRQRVPPELAGRLAEAPGEREQLAAAGLERGENKAPLSDAELGCVCRSAVGGALPACAESERGDPSPDRVVGAAEPAGKEREIGAERAAQKLVLVGAPRAVCVRVPFGRKRTEAARPCATSNRLGCALEPAGGFLEREAAGRERGELAIIELGPAPPVNSETEQRGPRSDSSGCPLWQEGRGDRGAGESLRIAFAQ